MTMGFLRILRISARQLISTVLYNLTVKSLAISRKTLFLICALAILVLIWILTLPSFAAKIPVPVLEYKQDAEQSKSEISLPESAQLETETGRINQMMLFNKFNNFTKRSKDIPKPRPIPAPVTVITENENTTPIPPRLVTQVMDSSNIMKMDQLDPRLWSHIKTNHITPPSSLPYTFPYGIPSDKPLEWIDPQVDQILADIFGKTKGGTFVEVGAFDGFWSHSLMYEAYQGWTGLLIECHPVLLKILKSINRKAYIADVCLSPGNHPEKGRLLGLDKQPGASSMGTGKDLFPNIVSNMTVYEVQTVPLYAIMAAVGLRKVDLFILDIQSLEIPVLKTFPFELVHVKVWVIEVYFLNHAEKEDLRHFMEGKGYSKDLIWYRGFDCIFVHETFKFKEANIPSDAKNIYTDSYYYLMLTISIFVAFFHY